MLRFYVASSSHESVTLPCLPADAYSDFFTLELPRLLIQRYQVRLIVYDPEEEVIIQWQT